MSSSNRRDFLDVLKNAEQINPGVQSDLLDTYRTETDNTLALEQLQAEINTRRQGLMETWQTGFSRLDKKLDGGFIGEQLICLGAISSLGKTSFALQVATQIAEQGKDVLFFSLEMSKNELNAKTISRYSYMQSARYKTLQKDYALTTRDILSGRINGVAFGNDMQATDDKGQVFVDAFNRARETAAHMHIFIGENDISVDDVRRIADCHKKSTGNRPFIVLDYLQILQQSEEARTNDKRLLTDYDVTRLKVLARDLHIPVMVISAFNRASYLDPVNMGSFRESSGIEYSSDILLAMQYTGMDYKENEGEKEHASRVRDLLKQMDANGTSGNKLPISLKILKNRNGSRGTVYFDFVPAYNYYEEAPGPAVNSETTGKNRPSVVSSVGSLGRA